MCVSIEMERSTANYVNFSEGTNNSLFGERARMLQSTTSIIMITHQVCVRV